jgi:hypothetical protein
MTHEEIYQCFSLDHLPLVWEELRNLGLSVEKLEQDWRADYDRNGAGIFENDHFLQFGLQVINPLITELSNEDSEEPVFFRLIERVLVNTSIMAQPEREYGLTEITDRNQVRFSIYWDGHARKIFTYFRGAQDGSLAIHTYLPQNEESKFTSFEIKGDGWQNARISLDDQHYTRFAVHKWNFHRSGVTTVKNSKGEYAPGAITNGRSFNLQNLVNAKTLASYVPTVLSRYPVVDNKKYHELTNGDWNLLPPNIQFFLSRKGYEFMNEVTEKGFKGRYFVDRGILHDLDIDLYISVHAHIDDKYPAAEAFFTLMYD